MLWFLMLGTTWNLRLPDARRGCCGKGEVFVWFTASPLHSDPEHLLLWHLFCSCTMCRSAKPSMDLQGWCIKCLEPWQELVVDLCDIFATDIASCMKENCSASLDWEHHGHNKFSDRGRLLWQRVSHFLSKFTSAGVGDTLGSIGMLNQVSHYSEGKNLSIAFRYLPLQSLFFFFIFLFFLIYQACQNMHPFFFKGCSMYHIN